MTLRHGILTCLLPLVLGACGTAVAPSPQAVDDGGEVPIVWFSSPDALQPVPLNAPFPGLQIGGIGMENEGRAALFVVPDGATQTYVATRLLVDALDGARAWFDFGDDLLIQRAHFISERDEVMRIDFAPTAPSRMDAHVAFSDGTEVLISGLDAPARLAEWGGRPIIEPETWGGPLRPVAASTKVLQPELAEEREQCRVMTWEDIDIIMDGVTVAIDQDEYPDGPHSGWNWFKKVRDAVRRLGRVRYEVPRCSDENRDGRISRWAECDVFPTTWYVCEAASSESTRSVRGGACCVDNVVGDTSPLPVDDRDWQQGEMELCNQTCLYRSPASILWSIPTARSWIKVAFSSDPNETVEQAAEPAPFPSASISGGESFGPLNLPGTLSHARGAFTYSTESPDSVISGTTPQLWVTHSGRAHHEPAPPNASAHSSAGLHIDVRAWARGTPVRTRYDGIPLENTLFPENPVMTGPGTYGTHEGGPLAISQEGWNSGPDFLEVPHPVCPDVVTRYYSVGVYRWENGLWGSRVTGRELVDRTMSGEVRFRVVGNGASPPVVSAHYEYAAPSSTKPSAVGDTTQTSASVPVLVFDELYDPDDFPDGTPTGFDRGITGVEYRVLGGGVDPKTPWSDLPPGSYDVEITAWDQEANSTTITVPLVIQ